jgi:hypothetical protein
VLSREWWQGKVAITRRLLLIGFIVPYMLIAVGAYSLFKANRHRIDDLQALVCRDKVDAARGLNRSYEYLEDFPNGAPGIPRALIRQGMIDDRNTLVELQHVDCDEADVLTEKLLQRSIPPVKPTPEELTRANTEVPGRVRDP